MNKRRFFEFFAGGGMARAGLGSNWQCDFANDFSSAKAAAYCANWGTEHFILGDVNQIETRQLPGQADLVWASFPCQDLSLAGAAAGLGTVDRQTRSGAFWAFWELMRGLTDEGRSPSIIALENVYGALTTNGGAEFASLCAAISGQGYRIGAMVIDACLFVPHSRPRLFIFGFRADLALPSAIESDICRNNWHPPAMRRAVARLDPEVRDNWLWLDLPVPRKTDAKLPNIIEMGHDGLAWHSPDETSALIAKMSAANLRKLDQMKVGGELTYGTVYRRTRPGTDGRSAVMAELRNDGVAGCLRTPGGGSSRQFVIEVEGNRVRSRLLSAREAARLMGLDDTYKLPSRYNDAYHLLGDGVVVDVVRFLERELFEPVLSRHQADFLEAAE